MKPFLDATLHTPTDYTFLCVCSMFPSQAQRSSASLMPIRWPSLSSSCERCHCLTPGMMWAWCSAHSASIIWITTQTSSTTQTASSGSTCSLAMMPGGSSPVQVHSPLSPDTGRYPVLSWLMSHVLRAQYECQHAWGCEIISESASPAKLAACAGSLSRAEMKLLQSPPNASL